MENLHTESRSRHEHPIWTFFPEILQIMPAPPGLRVASLVNRTVHYRVVLALALVKYPDPEAEHGVSAVEAIVLDYGTPTLTRMQFSSESICHPGEAFEILETPNGTAYLEPVDAT